MTYLFLLKGVTNCWYIELGEKMVKDSLRKIVFILMIIVLVTIISCSENIDNNTLEPNNSSQNTTTKGKYYIPVISSESQDSRAIEVTEDQFYDNLTENMLIGSFAPSLKETDSLDTSVKYPIVICGMTVELSLEETDNGYRFYGENDNNVLTEFIFSNDMKHLSYFTSINCIATSDSRITDNMMFSFGNNLEILDDGSVMGDVFITLTSATIDAEGTHTVETILFILSEQFSSGDMTYAFFYGGMDRILPSDSVFPDKLRNISVLDFDALDIIREAALSVRESDYHLYDGELIIVDRRKDQSNFNSPEAFSLPEIQKKAAELSNGAWNIRHKDYPDFICDSNFIYSGEWTNVYRENCRISDNPSVYGYRQTTYGFNQDGSIKLAYKYFREDGTLDNQNSTIQFYKLPADGIIDISRIREYARYEYYISNEDEKQYMLLICRSILNEDGSVNEYYSSVLPTPILLCRHQTDSESDTYSTADIVGTWGQGYEIVFKDDGTAERMGNIYTYSINGNRLHLSTEAAEDLYFMILDGEVLVRYYPDNGSYSDFIDERGRILSDGPLFKVV